MFFCGIVFIRFWLFIFVFVFCYFILVFDVVMEISVERDVCLIMFDWNINS